MKVLYYNPKKEESISCGFEQEQKPGGETGIKSSFAYDRNIDMELQSCAEMFCQSDLKMQSIAEQMQLFLYVGLCDCGCGYGGAVPDFYGTHTFPDRGKLRYMGFGENLSGHCRM